MYKILLTSTLLILLSCISINEKKASGLNQYLEHREKMSILDFKEEEPVSLHSFEKNRDSLSILKFISSNYNILKPDDWFSLEPEDLVKSTYAIDLNNDDLIDYIYSGPTSGENYVVEIFLNKSDHFDKIFSVSDYISNLQFSNSVLTSINIHNYGVSDDYQEVNFQFSVNLTQNTSKFTLMKTTGHLNQTEKPDTYFEEPIEFNTIKKSTHLSKDCFEIIDIEHPEHGSIHNKLATYPIGAKGAILGIKKIKNTDWLYVKMYATSQSLKTDYILFKEQPTELYGWINKSETNLKP